MEYKKLEKVLLAVKDMQEQKVLVNRSFMINLIEEVLLKRRSGTAKIRKNLCPDKL